MYSFEWIHVFMIILVVLLFCSFHERKDTNACAGGQLLTLSTSLIQNALNRPIGQTVFKMRIPNPSTLQVAHANLPQHYFFFAQA
jgi:hypothetical protein